MGAESNSSFLSHFFKSTRGRVGAILVAVVVIITAIIWIENDRDLPIPVGIQPSDRSTLVEDPESRFRLFSNEFAMGLKPGVSDDRIQEIARAAGGNVVGSSPPLRLYQVEITGDGTAAGVQRAINKISDFEEVEYAEPNHEVIPAVFPPDPPIDDAFPPNCLLTEPSCQWYMETIGALAAWRLAGGGSGIEVAVIEPEGSVDFSHPDLNSQGSQFEPCTGDDIVCNTPHPTQVAGLIAAKANNADGIPKGTTIEPGIAGVAYNSNLLAYQSFGTTQMSDLIETASDAGARVINLSSQTSNSTAVRDAIRYAISCTAAASSSCTDSLVVMAAANQLEGTGGACTESFGPPTFNTSEADDFERAFLVVGATAANDFLARWDALNAVTGLMDSWCSSNPANTDFYAPGKDIYSTAYDLTDSTVKYQVGSGTSLAAALTSGAAAVLWALNPDWTPQEVHARLIGTADLVNTDLGNCSDGNPCRRLNLFAAVNVNMAPTLNDSTMSVQENSAVDSSVGNVNATDPNDPGTPEGQLAYSIIAASTPNKFRIDGTGNILVNDGLDFEADPLLYSLTVEATDMNGTGLANTGIITINLTPVNEAPSLTVTVTPVAEDAGAGTVVGQATGSDPDAGDTHTYALSDSRFEVVGGNLQLKADKALDAEAEPSVEVTVTITDNAGLTATQTVTIDVSDVNEVLYFDGDDFVTIPNAANLSLQGLTLEAWVLMDAASFFRRPLISKGPGFGNYTLSVIGDQTLAIPGTVVLTHRVATGNFSCCAPARVNFNQWTHVAVTYSGGANGTATVYVNGEEIASTVSLQSPLQNNDPLFLGRAVFLSVPDHFHKGYLDEVRIWDDVRTSAEILANHRLRVDPTTPNLVGYWNFESSPDDQTVRDLAGGNNGTLGDDLTIGSDDPERVFPPDQPPWS